MKTTINILKSMRPIEALLKNGFVVSALIFGQRASDSSALWKIAQAYVLFWLVSCCVYIINDLLDRRHDSEHPVKKNRPIASGELAASNALAFALVALVLSFSYSIVFLPWFSIVLSAYFILNLAYSLYLKQLVIVDAMVVALGFVMRVYGGAVAINVVVQPWLLVSTLLLALLLAFAKRRHELSLLGEEAAELHRGVLSRYSVLFLDQIIAVVTAATLITYSLYTIDPGTAAKFGTHKLPYTMPFVLYGIFRYLYLVYKKEGGGHVGRTLITDIPLLVDVFLWGISIIVIIYIRP